MERNKNGGLSREAVGGKREYIEREGESMSFKKSLILSKCQHNRRPIYGEESFREAKTLNRDKVDSERVE